MSGRKQHFIPQSLLKGFAKAGAGKKLQVVVYPHGGPAFVAATDGIGAKRNFYSELDVEGMVETLDDRITQYETPMADVLLDLRAKNNLEDVANEQAAALVTHLIVRNDHFRKIAASAGTTLFAGLEDAVADQGVAAKMLGFDRNEPGKLFSDAIQKSWGESEPMLRALGFTRDEFEQFAFNTAKLNFSSLHSQMLEPMRNAFADVSDKVSGIAASSQVRALEQDIAPQKWIEKLSQYHWSVRDIEYGCILPDCIAICIATNGDSFPLIFSEDDAREFVVMPIASNRVLIGAAKEDLLPVDLNSAFARCSWDFFVANRRDDYLDQLGSEVRVHMQKYIDDKVTQIVGEAPARLNNEAIGE